MSLLKKSGIINVITNNKQVHIITEIFKYGTGQTVTDIKQGVVLQLGG
jgi:hypothetical protein